jgi:hypothetical protein
VLACVGCTATLLARASGDEPVISSERENALLAMFNVRDLPGGCTLADLSIKRSRAVLRYQCPGAPDVVLWVQHPEAAIPDGGVVGTERFVIIEKTSTPVALLDALLASVRTREGKYEWERAHSNPAFPPPAHPPGPFNLPLEPPKPSPDPPPVRAAPAPKPAPVPLPGPSGAQPASSTDISGKGTGVGIGIGAATVGLVIVAAMIRRRRKH